MKHTKTKPISEQTSKAMNKIAKGVAIPKAVPKPNGVGHPLLYDAGMCQALIEAGDKGLTKIQFCAKVGISKNTFFVWKDKYPEFAEAIAIYEAKMENWYTSLVKNCMLGIEQVVNGKKITLNLGGLVWFGKNVCNWKDKHEVSGTMETKMVEVSKEENALIE